MPKYFLSVLFHIAYLFCMFLFKYEKNCVEEGENGDCYLGLKGGKA